MKTFAVNCKICKLPISLQIDESYPAEKDPRNLTPYATCNPCYDLRERRLKIETQLKRACYQLCMETISNDARGKMEQVVRVCAANYSRWCADLLHRQHTANVGYLVKALLEQPDRWWVHLKDFEEATNQRKVGIENETEN